MPYVSIIALVPMNTQPTAQWPLRIASQPPRRTPASKTAAIKTAAIKTAAIRKAHPLALPSARFPVLSHCDILDMGVAIWNQWRCDQPMVIPNLQNADLSGMTLENINFSRTNLRGAQLDNAYLYDADFYKADLRDASLVRAGLVGASFHLANLSGANLERAYLNYSDLSSANCTGASLKASNLQEALLTKTILVDAQLSAAEMASSQDLTITQFKGAKDSHLTFVSDELQALTASFSNNISLTSALESTPKDSTPKDSTPKDSTSKNSNRTIASSRVVPSIEVAHRVTV